MALLGKISKVLDGRVGSLAISSAVALVLAGCAGSTTRTAEPTLHIPNSAATETTAISDSAQPATEDDPAHRTAGNDRPTPSGLAAGDDEETSWTRGQKTLMLNAGAATALITWGVFQWDYGQQSPKASSEGWFGQDDKEGGADKLGHFWSSYALSHLFASIYESWDYTEDEATTYGALSSLGFQTIMEVGDSFSDFGFSYQDMIMNVAGAGAGYLLRAYPQIGEKIDIRIEYAPSLDGNNTTDVFTDYEHQKFVVAVKGEGFEDLQGSAFEYLEFQVGYYTRGYDDFVLGGPETRRRTFYWGLGLNVGRVISHFWDTPLFDYFQVPGTYIPFEVELDE
ncbi:MAG: DUF2279 domain-containing protein [Alphaproteobacteria bacterium]